MEKGDWLLRPIESGCGIIAKRGRYVGGEIMKQNEFGTIERLNFDVGQVVEFILGEHRPMNYVYMEDLVRVVLPFLKHEVVGPHYYRETVVMLACYKLRDFAEMTGFMNEVIEKNKEQMEAEKDEREKRAKLARPKRTKGRIGKLVSKS